jgi:hypothetical protein
MGIIPEFNFRTSRENAEIKFAELIDHMGNLTPGAYVGVMLPFSTNIEDDILLVLREDYRTVYRKKNNLIWEDTSSGLTRQATETIETLARKNFDWSNWT